MRVALYLRVSTEEQTHEHQRADLEAEAKRRGWEIVEIFSEQVSGAAKRRPQLERLRHAASMSQFKAVFVWSIDRLGRNTLEVLTVAEELRGRGVGLVSYREPAVDTTGATGRLVLELMAAFAAFERQRLSDRTRAGLRTAKRQGKQLGRPRKATIAQIQNLLVLNKGSIAATARMLGVDPTTVSRAKEAAKRVTPNDGGPGPLFADLQRS
jgi:DNA invertase Pin-like site-specific DNA recombinase